MAAAVSPRRSGFWVSEKGAFFTVIATSPRISVDFCFFQMQINLGAIAHKSHAAKHVFIQLPTFYGPPKLKNQFSPTSFLRVFSTWPPNRSTFPKSVFTPLCASFVPTFMIFFKFFPLQTSSQEPINRFSQSQKSFRSKA